MNGHYDDVVILLKRRLVGTVIHRTSIKGLCKEKQFSHLVG